MKCLHKGPGDWNNDWIEPFVLESIWLQYGCQQCGKLNKMPQGPGAMKEYCKPHRAPQGEPCPLSTRERKDTDEPHPSLFPPCVMGCSATRSFSTRLISCLCYYLMISFHPTQLGVISASMGWKRNVDCPAFLSILKSGRNWSLEPGFNEHQLISQTLSLLVGSGRYSHSPFFPGAQSMLC